MSGLRIHVVSFASEGPPYDQGMPLAESVLETWGKMCLAGGATSYTGYTPRSIISENPDDAWTVKCYPPEHTIFNNPGYSSVGLGAWRALILNKALKSSDDGDVVVVHCSNFPKYPCMSLFASRLREYVEAVMTFTDSYVPPHEFVGAYCPAEVLALIKDQEFLETVARAPMGRCRLIIMRVNEKTRKFGELLLQTIKDDPLLLSPFNKTGYFGFHHHTAEQAVFNILAYREDIFPRNWRGTWVEALKNAGILAGSGTDAVLEYAKSLKK